MTIWHVAPDGALGGGAVIMARLLRELTASDPDAHMALIPRNADPDMAALFDGLPVRRGYYEGRANPLLFARAIAAVARRGDVIHAHGTRAAMAGALARLIQPGLTLIYTVHGFHGLAQPGPLGVRVRLEHLLARVCDRVVLTSQADCDLAARHGLRYGGRMSVIGNGVETPPAPADSEKDIDALFIGRFVYQKNPQDFVRVAALLPAGARVAMIGDGELSAEVDALIAQTGVAMERLGAIGWDAMIARLHRTRVLVMTSRWEGLPTSPIEAGMCRAAVCAYDISPTAEILGEALGARCLTAPQPEVLARTITSLLADEPERRRIADRLHDRMHDRYAPARSAQLYRALYADVPNT